MSDRTHYHDLPDYPKINPSFAGVALSPDEIHFRAGPWSGPVFAMEDDDEDGLLEHLLQLLDGTNPLQDILDEFGPAASEVEQTLRSLHDRGIVVEGRDAEVPEGIPGYLAANDRPVRDNVDHLKRTRVVVVTVGRPGEYVVEDLAAMGVGEIAIHPIDGRSLPQSLASRGNVQEGSGTPSASSAEDADLVVYAADRPKPELRRDINKLSHETGTPWIAGQVLGFDGIIGPMVVPGESSCYRCFERRSEANMPDADAYHTVSRAVTDGTPEPLPAYGRIVAGCLSIDALNYLTGGFRITIGRIVAYDFVDLSVEANDVLRLPRCPVCGVDAGSVDVNRHLMLDQIIENVGGGDND